MDGAEIECKNKTFYGADWEDVKDPMWLDDNEYRIKPQSKEQQYLYAWATEIGIAITLYKEDLPNQYKYIGKIKLENEDG